MEDLDARIRSAKLQAGPHVFPVVQVLAGCPLRVADAVFRAIGPALAVQGWETHLRSETGLAVLWIRPAVAEVPVVGQTQPALDVKVDADG